jgi:osmoprotectant transport system permease protein
MTRGSGPYKVGIAAAAIGLPLFLLLPFATVRRSRIATGVGLPPWEAIGPWLTAALAVLWVVVVVLSLRQGGRGRAAARGLLGASIIVAIVAASGWAASTLGPQTGQFARVSIGGGAWISAIAAYALVLASRRLLGRRSRWGVLMGVLAPVAIVAMLLSGFLDDLGIMKEYANVADRFWVETVNTVVFAAVAVTVATAVGVYLGMLAFRNQRLERPVFATVSVFQTIPGLAMVGLLVAPFAAASFALPVLRRLGIGGIGWAPVVTALTLYALLAIVRNTYAGLRNVPPSVVDAGRGMGMTDKQLMRKVELPLGMPVVFSGVRTSTVQTIGNATLGAFVGGITLGRFIFQGLAEQSPDLTMLGSIALVLIAVLADGGLRIAQSRLFRTHSVGGDGSPS